MRRSIPFLTLALCATAALAQGPDPRRVYVESISYGGSGCPQGTVGQSLSNDRSTFTLIFDSFVASTGPAVPITESAKNCQINVNLHVPEGYSLSLATVSHRGYAQLPFGSAALAQTFYTFGGLLAGADDRPLLYGPVARDYLNVLNVPLTSSALGACHAVSPLNINTGVRIVGGPNNQAQITVDSIDGKMTTLFSFQFLPC